MLRAVFLTHLVAPGLVPSLAAQIPLSPTLWQNGAILNDEGLTEWTLDKLPNPNDTDHLVFETVHSLLQHWPNTRMRNGHNIVPGTVPKGTVLYHTMNYNGVLPQGPEWLATDPEHAHIYCVDPIEASLQQTCTFLSLATTRPLKVVYFDGNSAANMPTGTVDTQELIAQGKITEGHTKDERRMIRDLCKWGKNLGVDGFLRMEMDFEIVLCDFTSGLELVSAMTATSRGAYQMFMPGFITFEVIYAGSWHDRFPGETRVQLDLAGLVSFYDTQLVPSLVPIRVDKERWRHRAQNASIEDTLAVKSMLEVALIRPSGQSSGIDWQTHIQVIVDRFAGRLELARHLLNSSITDPDEILHLANKTQSQLRIMLTPYLLFSATPTNPSDEASLDWTIPIYKLCSTTHTYAMDFDLDSMTESEKLLLRSIRGTSREICRVVTRMWAAGVYAGIDALLNRKSSPEIAEVTRVWNTWKENLNRLMDWLDWSVWVKCNPACGPEELCYLPTWPIGVPRGEKDVTLASSTDRPWSKRLTSYDVLRGNFATDVGNNLEPVEQNWDRPQPRCIRRITPREF